MEREKYREGGRKKEGEKGRKKDEREKNGRLFHMCLFKIFCKSSMKVGHFYIKAG